VPAYGLRVRPEVRTIVNRHMRPRLALALLVIIVAASQVTYTVDILEAMGDDYRCGRLPWAIPGR
jgi:hypothetical protein